MEEAKKRENFLIESEGKRPLVVDLYLASGANPKPIVIFCHGYKGFKDWGHFNLLPKAFTNAGMNFLKFNFSHNGGTVDDVIDFPDLDAFAKNNYSTEIDDIQRILNWIEQDNNEFKSTIDYKKIYLLGHSRGGGISILTAAQDIRISKLVTWAAVGDFARRFPHGDALAKWKDEGVYFVENSRTKQDMPHYYQFYEDFLRNQKSLNIAMAEKSLKIPHLLIHGTTDESVYIGEAIQLMSLNELTSLVKLKDATHTFGGSHPYMSEKLPKHAQMAVDYTVMFFSE